jgi:translation elongation factor P/translation initiation factor 5A
LIYIEQVSRALARVTENRERKTGKNANFLSTYGDGTREGVRSEKCVFAGENVKKRPLTVAGERPFFEGYGGAGGI